MFPCDSVKIKYHRRAATAEQRRSHGVGSGGPGPSLRSKISNFLFVFYVFVLHFSPISKIKWSKSEEKNVLGVGGFWPRPRGPSLRKSWARTCRRSVEGGGGTVRGVKRQTQNMCVRAPQEIYFYSNPMRHGSQIPTKRPRRRVATYFFVRLLEP